MKVRNLRQLTTAAVTSAALGVVMLGAAPRLRADDDHARCQHQIERAESKLDQAIRRHGEGSEQARDRRRDLNAQRERCWARYHGWWDARERRWHDAHDWDNDQDHHDDHHDDHHQ